MTRQCTSAKPRILRLLALLLAFGMGLCVAGMAPQPVFAADASYAIPQNTAQVWVDVEAADAADAAVVGKFADTPLEFHASASGVTAVLDENATNGPATLTLQAERKLDVLVAVTFADADGVILTEYTSNSTLDTTARPIQPGKPVTPTITASAAKPAKTSGTLTSTGSAVVAVAVVVAVAAAAIIMVIRHRAVSRQEGAQR